MGLQALENKVLSWAIIGKSAPILAEITIRKSQMSTVDQNSTVICLSATPVLSRLPALHIGIIDQETVIIEHCSLACCLDSTVLLACWLVLPLSLPIRSPTRRIDARSIPMLGCGSSRLSSSRTTCTQADPARAETRSHERTRRNSYIPNRTFYE